VLAHAAKKAKAQQAKSVRVRCADNPLLIDMNPKSTEMIISSGTAAPVDASLAAELIVPDDDLDDIGSASPDAAHLSVLREFTTDHEHHLQRLDRVLAQLLPDSSRSFLQQLIDSGDVRIQGKPANKAAHKIRAGELLQVQLRPLPQDTAFHPDAAVAKTLTVVHEDAHVMIINKAPGMVVHPAAGNWSGTLLNGLLAHHECHTLLPRASIVHRLDKDTSGLMVVARTREAMDALIRMIAAREVKRQYLAMAHYPWQGMSPRHVSHPIGRNTPAKRP
jgi:23S rRNA pseudouridine1911/1915/1917 synthase